MGRVYAVTFEGVAVTTAVDVFEILPATQKPCILHALYLSQSSDVGDAAEEILRVHVIRGYTATGSGGATPTPVPLNPADSAAGFSAETNNTTPAGTGTPVIVHSEAWNIRSGLQYIPPPEDRPVVKNAETLVVRLMAAPADSLTMSGTMIVEEI